MASSDTPPPEEPREASDATVQLAETTSTSRADGTAGSTVRKNKHSAADLSRGGCLQSLSERWTKLLLNFRRPIKRILLAVKQHAATHPKVYVLFTVVLSTLMLILGLATNFEVVVDEDVLYTPKGSRPLTHGNWIRHDSGFPLEPRTAWMFVHRDGANVLGQAGVRRVFEAVDAFRGTAGYDELCGLYAKANPQQQQRANMTTCPLVSATAFWSHSVEQFEDQISSDQEAIAVMSNTTYPDGTPVDRKSILGHPKADENGVLVSADMYMLGFQLPAIDDPAEAFEKDALEVTLDLQKEWDADVDNSFRLEIFAERSFADEFTRAIVDDIPLVPVVFIVMSIFTCIVFFKRDWIYSRCLLGFGAVVSVLLAIMTRYGLMFTIGVSFTSMTQILPFIVFGVGLDDAFIISGAFGLGSISSIPAVHWLCIYAFPTIIIVFLYQVTFFVALIVIDEQRIKDKRRDCFVCCVVESRAEETLQDEVAADRHLADRFMAWYGNHLLRPPVKGVVLVTFAALLAVCAWSASQLTEAFEFTDVVPSDSYLKRFFDALNAYSQRSGISPKVYFRFVDQSNPSIQSQMKEFVSDLVDLEQISDPPSQFWLWDFEDFVSENQEIKELLFNQQVALFLANPVFRKQYASDIVRNGDGDITASRTEVSMDQLDHEVVTEQVDALESQRRISAKQPVNAGKKDWAFFTFEGVYYMWEFYSVASDELLLTTILGIVAVSVVGLLFVPHWSGVLFVAPIITVLYVDLMGILRFARIHINPVSYVSLVMSIGLLVDFLMHVILRYFQSSADGRTAKTMDALETMGASILLGGISTFLGVLPLAFSTSEIFRTIFVTFLALVTLGMGHGLIFLPVLLSMKGPDVDIQPEEQDGEPCTENSMKPQTERTIEEPNRDACARLEDGQVEAPARSSSAKAVSRE